MHIISTTTLVVTASAIYKKTNSEKGLVAGLIIGTLMMGGVMMLANHFITPHFMGAPVAVVDAMLIPVILPFNLMKAGINSFVAYLVYKIIKNRIEF